MSKELLTGKTIQFVDINDTSEFIRFTTTDGNHVFMFTQGDCCNDVWFNHVNGLNNLVGATIKEIKNKDWREVYNWEPNTGTRKDNYREAEESCVLTFCTNKGYCDIEVRNSHNGYYGGEVFFTDNLDKNYYHNQHSKYLKIEGDF